MDKRMTTRERIDEWFSWHAPTDDQVEAYKAIRAAAKALALVIVGAHARVRGPDGGAAEAPRGRDDRERRDRVRGGL